MHFTWLSALYRKLRLQTKLVLLVCVMFVPPVILLNIHVRNLVDTEYHRVAGARAMQVAEVAAEIPLVKRFMDGRGELLPEVKRALDMLSRASQVRFIVLIDMNGLRTYHPNPKNIGKHVVGGDTDDVLQGKSYISFATGTFGHSLRAMVPIRADDGRQTGAVVVGIMADAIERTIARFVGPIWPTLFFLLLFGVFLAALSSWNIIEMLQGLEPEEIARRLEERGAMLRTVREGIVAVDTNARITLVNDEAERLLRAAGVRGEFTGRPVEEVVPNSRLREILQTGDAEFDCEQNLHGKIILTNRTPIRVKGSLVGAIATFRDMTEVRRLAEDLTGVNRYVDALRTQSHEFLNKLHVIYGLLQKDRREELADYLAMLIGLRSKDHETIATGIKDPVIAGLLSSKLAKARELGIRCDLEVEGTLGEIFDPKLRNGIVTIVGNIVDNSVDAMVDTPEKRMAMGFAMDADRMWITVADSGEGIEEAMLDRIFQRNVSTKGQGRGLGLYLVLLTVDSLGGLLEMDSAPGQGTRVTVHLPISKEGSA